MQDGPTRWDALKRRDAPAGQNALCAGFYHRRDALTEVYDPTGQYAPTRQDAPTARDTPTRHNTLG